MSHTQRRLAIVLAVVMTSFLVRVSAASAQEPAAAPVVAGWNDGFFVESADGDYRLRFGLLVQADQRWGIGDSQNNVIDSFTMRRLRPILQGRVAKFFGFYFVP